MTKIIMKTMSRIALAVTVIFLGFNATAHSVYNDYAESNSLSWKCKNYRSDVLCEIGHDQDQRYIVSIAQQASGLEYDKNYQPLQQKMMAYDMRDSTVKRIPVQLVDVKPYFNGGDANTFSKWVNENLVYPETAKDICV